MNAFAIRRLDKEAKRLVDQYAREMMDLEKEPSLSTTEFFRRMEEMRQALEDTD